MQHEPVIVGLAGLPPAPAGLPLALQFPVPLLDTTVQPPDCVDTDEIVLVLQEQTAVADVMHMTPAAELLTGPAGPCGPVAPVKPFGPATPCGPVAPVEPFGPGTPCGPAGPCAPVWPTTYPASITDPLRRVMMRWPAVFTTAFAIEPTDVPATKAFKKSSYTGVTVQVPFP